ncbi:MAG: flavodoxin [Sphaerochaetaceae bacterium]|nr:flavodoxin [Sphaerochaetaceae bacterium]
MSKVAVVYWSGTGNTEQMAQAVLDGVKSAGADADLLTCSEFSSAKAADYSAFAFGCPAMGDEVLEEGEFDPMFTECESSLSGKKVFLFGSYGWGDGAWMENWKERCASDGVVLASDPVICMNAPEDDTLEALKAAGIELSK